MPQQLLTIRGYLHHRIADCLPCCGRVCNRLSLTPSSYMFLKTLNSSERTATLSTGRHPVYSVSSVCTG